MSENDIAPRTDFDLAEITEPTTGALQRLDAEVRALDKAYHWAKAMSKTSMVPDHFRQTYIPKGASGPLGEVAVYNLAAAVMYGIEIGLSAMQSAQNVFVVHGRPAVYARTMAGQVRAAGYIIEPVEESDERVVWKGLRDGTWAFSEWTIERARQAGYTSNERYAKNPLEMLRAKAIAEICRIKFQDVLLGMAYSVEELMLENATVQRVTKPGIRGMAKLREIAESTPLTEDEDQAAPAEETVEGPTVAQLAEIKAIYRAQKVKAADMVDDINQLLQRENRLELKDLTREDAEELLQLLKQSEGDA